jgi:hypothetical protein
MPQPLPPFSGDDTQCPKCSNNGAFTKYQEAEMLGPSYLQRERLQRCCARCDYTWDEALNPPTEDGT